MFSPVNVDRVAQVIVDQIKLLIRDGRLLPGDRLPSERELCQHFGVSRVTVRQSLQRLAAAGLVKREPSTADRRIKRVVVTEAGYRLFDTVKTEAALVRKELLSQLDPKKLEAAADVLEALQGIIEAAP